MTRIQFGWRALVLVLLSLLSLTASAGTTLYYLHDDQVGAPVVATDQNQTVVWRADKTPFGAKAKTGDSNQIQVPLGFPGQYSDPETGFNYNYYRDYDPSLGRYVESDPTGLNGGLNTYAYSGGNPVNYVDSFGLAPGDVFNSPVAAMTDSIQWSGDQWGNGQFWETTAPYKIKGPNGCSTGKYTYSAKLIAKGFYPPIIAGPGAAEGLPKNPDDLLRQGYDETGHPNAAKAGHRTFENSNTGDKVRFDKGKPGKPGYQGQDHYHRYNPNATGAQNMYLDKNGNPTGRLSNASHLFPGD